MTEIPFDRHRTRSQCGPVMAVVVARDLFERPAEIRRTEGDSLHDRGKLEVVDEDDASAADEPAQVDQVDENAIEPVVAVHEREIEQAPLDQKRGSPTCDS